jgi:hypothetical protein
MGCTDLRIRRLGVRVPPSAPPVVAGQGRDHALGIVLTGAGRSDPSQQLLSDLVNPGQRSCARRRSSSSGSTIRWSPGLGTGSVLVFTVAPPQSCSGRLLLSWARADLASRQLRGIRSHGVCPSPPKASRARRATGTTVDTNECGRGRPWRDALDGRNLATDQKIDGSSPSERGAPSAPPCRRSAS